jgi:hypothetical protein
MIHKKLPRLSFLLGFLSAAIAQNAAAQTSVFTYQGRLNDGGTPANGIYDFQFGIYDSSSQLAVIGRPTIAVTNGLFTSLLDFGPAIFDGNPRWLEISVRTNGAVDFTTFSNRQLITSAPYAVQSLSARSVASTNISGSLALSQLPPALVTNGSSGVSFTGGFNGNGGGLTNLSASALPTNVALLDVSQTFTAAKIFNQPIIFTNRIGVGTFNPDSPLAVQGIGLNGEWITLKGTNGATRWHMNNTSGGLNFVQTGVADFRLFLSTNGNVGVGVSDPQAKLHVAGDIAINNNGGTNFAASGTENLRIVRGTILDNGSFVGIYAGKGFTVAHPTMGAYTITFSPAFGGIPSFTATGFASVARADTVSSITTSQVKVSLINTVGAAVNDSFSFIAVGPAD